jgi:hypothetical protein
MDSAQAIALGKLAQELARAGIQLDEVAAAVRSCRASCHAVGCGDQYIADLIEETALLEKLSDINGAALAGWAAA